MLSIKFCHLYICLMLSYATALFSNCIRASLPAQSPLSSSVNHLSLTWKAWTRHVSEFRFLFRHICIYIRHLRYLSLNITLIGLSYKPCAHSLSVSIYNVIGCLCSDCNPSHEVRSGISQLDHCSALKSLRFWSISDFRFLYSVC